MLRNAAQRPNNNANPSGLSKKYLLRRKSAILSLRWKFHCIAKSLWRYSYKIWRYLVRGHFLWPRIRPKNLIRGLSCMHER